MFTCHVLFNFAQGATLSEQKYHLSLKIEIIGS